MAVTPRLTFWFLLALVLVVCAYALVALMSGDERATVSDTVYRLTSQAPILAFLAGLAIGVLAGHILWPQFVAR